MFVILVLVCLVACTKEPTLKEIQLQHYAEVLSKLTFDCNDGIVTDNHFSGNINGDTVCYNDNIDDYVSQLGLGWKAVTTSPYLNTNAQATGRFIEIGFSPIGETPPYGNKPFIVILSFRMENFPPDMLYETIADSVFRVGKLPLLGLADENSWGVRLNLMSRYQKEGSTGLEGFTISSAQGDQPPESRIEFTEVTKTKHDDYMEYHVVLKANCLLYHALCRGQNQLFGELKNGTLEATYQIPYGY